MQIERTLPLLHHYERKCSFMLWIFFFFEDTNTAIMFCEELIWHCSLVLFLISITIIIIIIIIIPGNIFVLR